MNTSTTTRPSLETLGGLYAAVLAQEERAKNARARVLESAERHGYTEQQVAQAAVRHALSGASANG